MVILQLIASGVLMGGEYVLASVGLTLIFAVCRVLNLAHGAFFALGAYLAYETTQRGLPALVGAVPAVVVGVILGMFVDAAFVRPLHDRPLAVAILLLALATASERVFALLWGPATHSVPLSPPPAMIGHVVVQTQQIAASLIGAGVIAALAAFLHTRMGLAFRAAAAQREIATVSGINAERVRALTFGIGCGMAAVAGAFVSPLIVLSPEAGRVPLMLSCAMMIAGRPGSIRGAVAAAFGGGVATVVTGYYLPPSWSYILALAVIIALTARVPSPAWTASRP
jgi:branched-chain amino acid transport system permease protein